MTEAIIRVNEQGRVTIPADLRQLLGLVNGSKLIIRLEGKRIVLEQPEEAFARLRSTFNSPTSVVDELIAERRDQAAHE
ncbi:AbrB/MazE/SpoVT family DNA-binding domain-containing protein [Chroococcidiopsis sp. FACHB-1243]|uniref:AbrB/MazE/SpoVT family DNA-binding domain-containing protein n=1 Tax=unclassified Chroococcidiopsis TaxID=2646205 RepID=UPI001782F0BE|nr:MULTISPECIES: AbrB/MazE/SpoVT family DNA-binding domain-containing protein [unclassified Chroococcidiopsis]MBD2309915.1 AbrB/MazE/SpoVT family DNA-binding domain-containing protein [Chroococcidiopsis sp. [FACHB-1243]]URD53800.1 AbrB/MazE/SpoVT family DNA-binding domain-containing protein [Chroococcidiopsis sp. CCNUC1]